MWLLYAVGSALFAGLTSILAKCGIRKTDSTVATAIRTIIVLVFAWVMVFVVGSQGTIASIPARSLVFLGLSVWLRVPAGCAIFMPYSAGQSIRSCPSTRAARS